MSKTMDRLEIDDGIRGLVGKLWKHGYKTLYSCEGHKPRVIDGEMDINTRYISYVKGTGDGWLEKNASELGFIERDDGTAYDSANDVRVKSIAYYAENPYIEELDNGTVKIKEEFSDISNYLMTG